MNYKNYDENALADYLKTYGIDKSATKQLYQYVIENPATYLSYSIGYYELNKLEKEMGCLSWENHLKFLIFMKQF